MKTWRISIEEAALDRTCTGAREKGGHWNEVGTPAMYAGATVELCALEKFVHIDGEEPDAKLVLVSIELPDDPMLCRSVGLTDLPERWDDLPVSDSARHFGTRFLQAGQHLFMCVPSVIIPEACNFVINPDHPAFGEVRLQIVRPFAFDPRMFKR